MASAIPAASSAPVTVDFMVLPGRLRKLRKVFLISGSERHVVVESDLGFQ